MSRIAAAAAEIGAIAARDAAVGFAGGLTGTTTPGHSMGGAAGTIAGQQARQRVQEIQTGANLATQRQVYATRLYAKTGQAVPAASQMTAEQNAAVRAQIAAGMLARTQANAGH